MPRIEWTGWGILAYPPVLLGPVPGMYLAHTVFGHLYRAEDGGTRLGVMLGGFVFGYVLGGLLGVLIGLALNLRRSADGRWESTERHELFGMAMERTSGAVALVAFALLPAAGSVGFVPGRVSWILLGAGLLVALIVLVVVIRVADRADERRLAAKRGEPPPGSFADAVGSVLKAIDRAAALPWRQRTIVDLESNLKRIEAALERRHARKLRRSGWLLDAYIDTISKSRLDFGDPVPFPQQRVDDLVDRLRQATQSPTDQRTHS